MAQQEDQNRSGKQSGRKRASTFANSSAIAPPAASEPSQEASETEDVADQAEEAPQRRRARKSSAGGEAPKKKPVSFYMDPEEIDRARSAQMFTAGHTGLMSKTAFYEEAVAQYVRELEAKYNDSKPFPPVP